MWDRLDAQSRHSEQPGFNEWTRIEASATIVNLRLLILVSSELQLEGPPCAAIRSTLAQLAPNGGRAWEGEEMVKTKVAALLLSGFALVAACSGGERASYRRADEQAAVEIVW